MADSMYDDPAYYQLLFGARRSDLDFYLGLADETGGAVLELGVGAGRVALPLARAGHDVTGVDLSPAMLAALEAAAGAEPPAVRARLRWHRGDARALELGRRFDLVICPFNGIAHHHGLDELGAFLHTVAAHLAPGGLFAFDTLLPDPALLRAGSAWVPWLRDPERGEVCRAEETTTYDAVSQVLTITTRVTPMESDRPPRVLELRLRQLFPQETLLLLRHHGFAVVRRDLGLGDVIGYVCGRELSSRR